MINLKIASDHAGFQAKAQVLVDLDAAAFNVQDLGPTSDERVDYPDFADRVCTEIKADDLGILICGSGQGMVMRANKYSNIRAALCWSVESAKLAKEHNNANVLCLGSRLLDADLIRKIIVTFLETPFAGGRHQGRVEKIARPLI